MSLSLLLERKRQVDQYEFEDSLVYPPRESSKPARLHRDLVSKKQKEEVAGVPHSGQSAGYL